MTEVKEVTSEQACIRMMWTHLQSTGAAIFSSPSDFPAPGICTKQVSPTRSREGKNPFSNYMLSPSHRQLLQQLKSVVNLCRKLQHLAPFQQEICGIAERQEQLLLYFKESMQDTSLQERSYRMGQGIVTTSINDKGLVAPNCNHSRPHNFFITLINYPMRNLLPKTL